MKQMRLVAAGIFFGAAVWQASLGRTGWAAFDVCLAVIWFGTFLESLLDD